MIRLFFSLFLFAVFIVINGSAATKPRLVVVISIDQFPYHYFTRFSSHFGNGGFRILLDDGAVFANARYNHAFNLTGPGHAVIATGCNPAQNGIVGNNWFNVASGKTVYSAGDSTVRILGAASTGRSPVNLRTPSFGDALRVASGFASRVVSISQKDRSAIFMGGLMANAAYWLVDSSWVSSTYYMPELPNWVTAFNRNGMATSFRDSVWQRMLPLEAYADLDRDDAPYEDDIKGLGRVFPHPMTKTEEPVITPRYFDALWHSPFLNDLLFAFARQAVIADSLGGGSSTDMLCIGLSANDAVGHGFGPQSHEVLDMTVRTDRQLAEFFAFLDEQVGLENTVLVLSSDHGIAPIPEYLHSRYPSAPAGRVGSKRVTEMCEGFLDRAFTKPGKNLSWIARVVDGNIYLNPKAITAKKLKAEQVIEVLADSLRGSSLIEAVLTRDQAIRGEHREGISEKLRRNYFDHRSGDLVYALRAYYLDYAGPTGTDHGQPYDYDAHVPVILRGAGILPGVYFENASPADIAPTLSALLGVDFPPAHDGRILVEALRSR